MGSQRARHDRANNLNLLQPKSVISFENRLKQKPYIYLLNFEFYHTSKIVTELLGVVVAVAVAQS